ncbi:MULTISPECIES: sugar ABC transporter substrate-binding protein [unclassified Microbacterium]|uniref:sugar ABC transporter substrate-binding protein n=1 Tax=unclassified Microbacterium TaxID=2609290 RepID=UPI000C2C524F|nr:MULTISPECIES: sugar ABC transporter substrate-binding protein [unclassified Microbacterium]
MTKSFAHSAIAATAVIAALVFSGCSSSSPDASPETPQGSEGVSQDMIDLVAQASGEIGFEGPASSPGIVPDQSIAVITCAAAAAGCVRVAEGVKAAGELVGWSVSELDGQGQAAGQNSAILQAVSQGVDGIVLVAIDSSSVSQGMSAAADAGIPVVSVQADNVVGNAPTDVYAEPVSGSLRAGEALGAYAVVESDATAKVATLSTDELAVTRNRTAGFVEQIDACSGCEVVDTQNYLLSKAVTDVPLLVSSMLQSHPDLDYIFVDIGQFGALTAQAIQSAGSEAEVLSVDCNPDDIVLIRDGAGQSACAANALGAGGWAAVAALNFAIAGEPTPEGLVVPTKLITVDNLPDTDEWAGDFDLAAEYGAFWGIN